MDIVELGYIYGGNACLTFFLPRFLGSSIGFGGGLEVHLTGPFLYVDVPMYGVLRTPYKLVYCIYDIAQGDVLDTSNVSFWKVKITNNR